MPLQINANADAIAAQANRQMAGQIQATVNVAGTAGSAALEELVLLKLASLACTQREAARARAKFGAQSAQAQRLVVQAQKLEQGAVAIEAQQERFQAPPVQAAPDAYLYQGRVTDDRGLGVAGRVVTAYAQDGSTLLSTTTDERGNYTLQFAITDQAPSAAERAAAADPANRAGAKFEQAAIEAGEVAFTVAVSDASGAALGSERVSAAVKPGAVEGGAIVLEQAAREFEFDPTARYAFTTRR